MSWWGGKKGRTSCSVVGGEEGVLIVCMLQCTGVFIKKEKCVFKFCAETTLCIFFTNSLCLLQNIVPCSFFYFLCFLLVLLDEEALPSLPRFVPVPLPPPPPSFFPFFCSSLFVFLRSWSMSKSLVVSKWTALYLCEKLKRQFVLVVVVIVFNKG